MPCLESAGTRPLPWRLPDRSHFVSSAFTPSVEVPACETPALIVARVVDAVHQGLVERGLPVVLVVAAGDEIEKGVEIAQTERGEPGLDFPAAVRGAVADLADEIHPQPQGAAEQGLERVGVDEAGELLLIGEHEGAVRRVHPLDGELHGAAAVDDAGGGIDMQRLLRRHGGIGEGGKARIAFQKFEVGHGVKPLRIPQPAVAAPA